MDLLKVSAIQKLYINDNKMQSVPSSLAAMERIELVNLDNNPLQKMPTPIPDLCYYRGMTPLPGPRWDLLKEHFEKELGINQVEPEASYIPD
mmetsp:Transcript_47657/g.74386  ORF Transcript_47657/g.74386 Transcript_47657/m.74386 type:complete len:92 (+) Transcript_47657:161-436(+)